MLDFLKKLFHCTNFTILELCILLHFWYLKLWYTIYKYWQKMMKNYFELCLQTRISTYVASIYAHDVFILFLLFFWRPTVCTMQ